MLISTNAHPQLQGESLTHTPKSHTLTHIVTCSYNHTLSNTLKLTFTYTHTHQWLFSPNF
jgi:hypothetical protein